MVVLMRGRRGSGAAIGAGAGLQLPEATIPYSWILR
jgi:hypothetical protein